VEITVKAAEKLTPEGIKCAWFRCPQPIFLMLRMRQYRESVLPSDVSARVAVEAGIADYWYKYVGLKGAIVGMTGYGESAPPISCSRTSVSPWRMWSKKPNACLTCDPQRGPGIWPMPVITFRLFGVTRQAKALAIKTPARLTPQSANPRPLASVVSSRVFSSKLAFINSSSLVPREG
jgi:hypothetical protein